MLFASLQPFWLSTGTIQLLLADNAPLAIVAAAMTFAIIAGNIDLSPGSMIALAGVVMGLVFQATGSLAAAVLACFVCVLIIGLLNGLLVAKLGLSAIVVTLATYNYARGLAVGLSDAESISVSGGVIDALQGDIGGGFTPPVLIAVAVYAVGWYLLGKTRTGRYTFAMGGDPAGARLAGINLTRQTLVVFLVMALATGLATLVTVAQLSTAQPLAGNGIELDAIIAVVIGGSRLTGGQGSVVRTALGVLFIAILNSGLANLGLPDAYFLFWKGTALLAVLTIQVMTRRWLIPALGRRWSPVTGPALAVRDAGVPASL
jgi:ribose/xylose/arabinose/galactoside ABC-type transport system permease subunit